MCRWKAGVARSCGGSSRLRPLHPFCRFASVTRRCELQVRELLGCLPNRPDEVRQPRCVHRSARLAILARPPSWSSPAPTHRSPRSWQKSRSTVFAESSSFCLTSNRRCSRKIRSRWAADVVLFVNTRFNSSAYPAASLDANTGSVALTLIEMIPLFRSCSISVSPASDLRASSISFRSVVTFPDRILLSRFPDRPAFENTDRTLPRNLYAECIGCRTGRGARRGEQAQACWNTERRHSEA